MLGKGSHSPGWKFSGRGTKTEQARQREARAAVARVKREAREEKRRQRQQAARGRTLDWRIRAKADEWLPKQCEICGSPNRLAVDHDHATGAVRGRLCDNCNQGLGRFQDNPQLLIFAAAYLERARGMTEIIEKGHAG